MPSDSLFAGVETTTRYAEMTSGEAWLNAMLNAEALLVEALAATGHIPAQAAEVITAACEMGEFDLAAIAAEAAEAATPVVPLVEALRKAVPENVREFVHYGATSQDIADTAMMIVVMNVTSGVADDLRDAIGHCRALVEAHRTSIMAGRTLLQQAVPTTFGLKAAGWMVAMHEARMEVLRVQESVIACQLGGAAGTLASFGANAVEVVDEFRIGSNVPVLPWHTNRTRVAAIAAALGMVSGVCGKIALDVTLMAQSEVGEVSEGAAPGRGRSSAMPQKRNPVLSVMISAAARQTAGLVGTLFGAMAQEHERGAGSWQSEWGPMSRLCALAGGAAERTAELLEKLEVHPARMRRNLDAGGGFTNAEYVMQLLTPKMGREVAQAYVRALSAGAMKDGVTLREALERSEIVRGYLSEEERAAGVNPAEYLGASEELIERALAVVREME